MITTNLTLDERFEWLKNNQPKDVNPPFGYSWSEYIEKEVKADMYTYCFNHPYYIGEVRMSDDEQRHLLLDELNVPRTL